MAIVLDPKSDEYLSLISIVYCGKSREDLLASQEAVEAQIKLQTVLKHSAAGLSRRRYWSGGDRGPPSHTGEQKVSDVALSPTAAHYLDGIRIKLAEEGEKEASPSIEERALPTIHRLGEGKSPKDVKVSSPHKAASPKSSNLPSSLKSGEKVSPKSPEGISLSCLKSPSRPPSISGGGGAGEGGEGGDTSLQAKESTWVWLGQGREGAEKVIPREWHVLSCPLPKVPTLPQSLLTSLKESMKESQFHESVYYSKKKVSVGYQGRSLC